jgi:hypothetical protein
VNAFVILPRNISENDFTFIVGDSYSESPSVIAAVPSARISSFQSIDPMIQEFMIDTNDSNHCFRKFLIFFQVLRFGSILNIESYGITGIICGELLNRELYERIYGRIEGKLILSNAVDQL